MTQMVSSVSINIITREERIWAEGGGALQITIDGCRLNKYVNEDDWNPETGWKEYAGDHLFGDLYEILETTAEIAATPEVYNGNTLYFDGYNDYLLLEYLGEGILRVAYRVNPDRNISENEFPFHPVPESACGYPVKFDAWAEAVQHAVEEFQEKLRDNDEAGQADWFDDELDKLKTNLN